MCNLANPSLETETPMRVSANSRSRALPRGVMGRLAKSARPRFVSRHAFALAMVGGLLLLGASPAAWATSTVRFDGVVSTPGTPSIVSSLPTGAAVDASARPSSSDPSGHVNPPSAVAFGHVIAGCCFGCHPDIEFYRRSGHNGREHPGSHPGYSGP